MVRTLVGSALALVVLAPPAPAQRMRNVPYSNRPPVVGATVPHPSRVGPAIVRPIGAGAYGMGGYRVAPVVGNSFGGFGGFAGFGGLPGFGGIYAPYGYPYSYSYYGGLGGGYYSLGYTVPYLGGPGAYEEAVPAPAPAAPSPPTHIVELSGQAPATLTMEFPAAATVWLDGKEVAGDAATVRALTSPVLRPGEQYTFHVRARWESNGTTYETTRDVPLGPGDRSRLLVVSGTAVKGE